MTAGFSATTRLMISTDSRWNGLDSFDRPRALRLTAIPAVLRASVDWRLGSSACSSTRARWIASMLRTDSRASALLP